MLLVTEACIQDILLATEDYDGIQTSSSANSSVLSFSAMCHCLALDRLSGSLNWLMVYLPVGKKRGTEIIVGHNFKEEKNCRYVCDGKCRREERSVYST